MFEFKSVTDFIKHYDTEDKCRKALELIRWNGQPACVCCGSTNVYRFKDNRRFKCAEKECRKLFSVTVGTVLENSKLPLTKWFYAMYICLNHKKGISSHQLSRDLGITQKAAWHVLHRIRTMVKAKAPQMLKGTVEADESFFGGKASNKHAKQRRLMFEKGTGYVHKTAVMGLVERGGNVVAFRISEAKGFVMKPHVRRIVDKNAMLVTDGFGGYKDLDKEYQKHIVINHANGIYGFEVYTNGEFVKYHTNTIEGFWSQMKRGVYGIYHQVSPKHLDRYCDEFVFRYNTRKTTNSNRFFIGLKQTEGCRLKYADLIAKVRTS